jgi:hypothetical protein
LAFDLSSYPTDTAAAWLSLTAMSPLLWLVATGCLALATLRFARTRWAWLLGALTMILASPRIHQPYLAGLLVGAGDRGSTHTDASTSRNV